MSKALEGTNFEILLISTDRTLKEQLALIPKVTLVIQLAKIEPNISCKSVMVDGELVTFHELQEIRKYYPKIPIFYKMHKVTNYQLTKNIQATCAAHNIHSLSEYLEAEQVKEDVERILFHTEAKGKNKVIGFFGTHSGAGVTSTILNVADLLGKKINGKVLVLSLNPWDTGDYYLPYEGRYLSDLKIELKTDSLTVHKLIQYVHQYESFSLLAGNRDIKLQRYFKKDEISRIILLAKEVYDVVLLDGGTHFDNAANAQVYKHSDLKFLVTTQDIKGFRGYWPHVYHQLLEPLGIKTDELLLIINQFCQDLTLITEKNLAEELDISLLATIEDQSLYGKAAIAQKKLLHEVTPSKDYRMSIEKIVNSIISRAQLISTEGDVPNTEEKGFFSRIFSK